MIHDTMLATSFDDMPCICVLGRTASGCRNTQSYRAAAGYKTPQHSPAACGHLVPPSAQAWPLSQTLPRVWQCWKPPRRGLFGQRLRPSTGVRFRVPRNRGINCTTPDPLTAVSTPSCRAFKCTANAINPSKWGSALAPKSDITLSPRDNVYSMVLMASARKRPVFRLQCRQFDS